METETVKRILPGEEPERLRRYIDLLFADVDQVFPNRIVDPTLWKHDRWDQATALLCKELGYLTGEDFLSAYGYIVAAVPKAKLLDQPIKPVSTEDPGVSEPGDGKEEAPDTVAETDSANMTTKPAEEPAPGKPTVVDSVRVWWKRTFAFTVKKADRESQSADEKPVGDTASDEETLAEGTTGREEENLTENGDAQPEENAAAEPEENLGKISSVDGPAAENDSVSENMAEGTESELLADTDAAADSYTVDPEQNETAQESPDVYDEASYREIPLNEPAVTPNDREEYAGKHSRPAPETQVDDEMQALLEEFANADVPAESVAPESKRGRPASKPLIQSEPIAKREYTPKELFEATFGGIDAEEEQEDQIERVFADEEPQDQTPAFIKKLSAKFKAREKTFRAVFAGILIMAVLAVFLRIVLDRHEAAVQAEQEALAAAEQNITYVDTGSFTVSVTLPAAYTEDPDLTQKEYNTLAGELGYDKMLLQADGALVYIMSRSRQYQMRSEVSAEVVAFFDGIPNSSAYPEIVSVEPDSNYTTVKVTLSGSDVPAHMATLATDMAYYCGKYQRVNGANLPTLVITVYNNEGEKIDTYKPTCP